MTHQQSNDTIEIRIVIPQPIIIDATRNRQTMRSFQEFLGRIIFKMSDLITVKTYDSIRSSILHSAHLIKNTDCAICLENLRLFSSIKIPPCLHGFHAGCMDKVIEHRFDSCPVCRQRF